MSTNLPENSSASSPLDSDGSATMQQSQQTVSSTDDTVLVTKRFHNAAQLMAQVSELSLVLEHLHDALDTVVREGVEEAKAHRDTVLTLCTGVEDGMTQCLAISELMPYINTDGVASLVQRRRGEVAVCSSLDTQPCLALASSRRSPPSTAMEGPDETLTSSSGLSRLEHLLSVMLTSEKPSTLCPSCNRLTMLVKCLIQDTIQNWEDSNGYGNGCEGPEEPKEEQQRQPTLRPRFAYHHHHTTQQKGTSTGSPSESDTASDEEGLRRGRSHAGGALGYRGFHPQRIPNDHVDSVFEGNSSSCLCLTTEAVGFAEHNIRLGLEGLVEHLLVAVQECESVAAQVLAQRKEDESTYSRKETELRRLCEWYDQCLHAHQCWIEEQQRRKHCKEQIQEKLAELKQLLTREGEERDRFCAEYGHYLPVEGYSQVFRPPSPIHVVLKPS